MRRESVKWQRWAGGHRALSWLVALLGIAFGARPAAAESILLNPPDGWNGIMVSGSIRAGWRQSGGAAEAFTSATSFLVAGPSFPPLTPGQVLTGSPLALSVLPTAGDAKDKAEVSLAYSVTVGAAGPSSSDTFNFAFSGQTSAVNARYDFGGAIGLANADALIAVDIVLTSFGPIPASAMASIGLPALPFLSAPAPNIEALFAQAKIGPYGAWTTVVTMGPGDPGSTLPLVLDPSSSDAFEYTMSYVLLTPYGTDPSVSFNLEGSMARSAVPEIGLIGTPIAFLGAAIGLLDARQRRRRPR